MSKMPEINESISWKDITPGGTVYETGNSKQFFTGDWKSMKPVLKEDKCKQCLLCAPVCPDCAIPVKDGKRLDFNLDYCKGCGICVKVCPFDAIDFVKDEK